MSRYGIKDVFLTLQGEGAQAGRQAVFVRFTGCNLWDGHPLHRDRGVGPCAQWCDTDFFKGGTMSTDELVARMGDLHPSSFHRFCVLTGGEPCLQVDVDLLMALQSAGWTIAVETNGTVTNPALVERADWVCVAPKHGTDWTALGRADELKVILPGVVGDAQGWKTDEMAMAYSWALERNPDCEFFVQPQDPLVSPDLVEATALHRDVELDEHLAHVIEQRFQGHLSRCVDWVLGHPEWRLSYQTHKAIGLR